MHIDGFWAVVPAGGAGTRLWPLSRSGSPKFLHDLTGRGRTLLEQTRERLAPLAEDRVLVVTGERHRAAVRAQLPDLSAEAVLAEPSPRDSMAAIGLAAAHLERQAREHDQDLVLGSFAADHVITEPDIFQDAVRRAAAAAREGWLVTIGIEPTFPSPAFGYLQQGEPLPGGAGAHRVRQFVEKPSVPVAEEYVASGEYRWNAGMFVARPQVLLDLLAEQDPDFAATLRAIAAEPDRLGELWPRLPRIAIDHAVAEPAAAAGRVATVPGDFGWEDVGDFDALGSLLGDQDRVQVLGDGDAVLARDASGVVVPASGRTIALIGLDDVVVVDTPDALLVTTRERAQDVKQVVAALKERGRDDLT
ncbi:NTP transferase domain-containing protein [Nocardioides panacisoli]|uniref:mannose-1-phosphate guanylyltransferase n=1 Tax=Nocardioides panacisoli TaxID=627624 RepID=UPI001C629DBB|nr:mannose-1-phosphate guanylyltransferase [Nocardioides panacisoli]QYJ04400.1 NTP transferase domain-containing protein [Nocardioides panacisoli]